MRLKLLLILLTIVSVVAFCILYFTLPPVPVVQNNFYVGNKNVGNKPVSEVITMLDEKFERSMYLNIGNTSRAVSLKEIGISYDRENLISGSKNCRVLLTPVLCGGLFDERTDIRDHLIIDKAVLGSYFSELQQEYFFIANNTIISFEDHTFRAPGPDAEVVIDTDSLTSYENIPELFIDEVVKLKLDLRSLDDPAQQAEKTKALLPEITKPLLIKYGRNPVSIPTEVLTESVKFERQDNFTSGRIDPFPILKHLGELSEKYGSEDVELMETEAVRAVQNALLYRSTGYPVNNAVILPIEGKPRSLGELHEEYLEVIKSQQRLYRFEDGELVKTYIVSTGLTWETPAGDYSVLGKQKMTISYFGNWYMPNYLPIGLINGSYRFGFHAIPYHMDGGGNIYSRDPNTMGSPATGGCIQLTESDSLELFDWARIGIPVYIYE